MFYQIFLSLHSYLRLLQNIDYRIHCQVFLDLMHILNFCYSFDFLNLKLDHLLPKHMPYYENLSVI